jgi:capsular exopolysaccharide synthesis family protein
LSDTKYDIKYKLSDTIEEAYKVLRANILFCKSNNQIKTITVTSYTPGEGKTTTSINLAITMGKSGMKVLYVDADLRKPMTYKTLINTNFKGLSNFLMGKAEIKEIINNTNIEGFYFITCGVKPPNPGELICTERFSKFIWEIQKDFDLVIIDTPPLGSVIDSAVIAAQTDGTILVIKPDTVKRRNALMMKEQLVKANAKIIGVVLNKVDKIDYKNYYCGYDYYGSKKKYKNKSIRGRMLKRGIKHD